MVEGRDGFVSSIEHSTFAKLVAHTIHRWSGGAIREIKLAKRGPGSRPGGRKLEKLREIRQSARRGENAEQENVQKS
jgi:hypothetical protein